MSTTPRPALRFFTLALVALVLLMLVSTLKLALGFAKNAPGTPSAAYLGQAVMVLGALPALAASAFLWGRRPVDRHGWAQQLAGQTLVLALGAGLLAPVSIPFQAWLSGQQLLFHGSLLAVAISHFITTATAVGAVMAVETSRALRDREAQALQLQTALAEARLDALALQLQPHFLFNTLNAVTALLHRDPAAADAMLTRLADLLRATLQSAGTRAVPLRDELALLDRYLDIMQLRYGPRLAVRREIAPSALDRNVPPFLLQPLVENALEHGIGARPGPGTLTLRAEVVGEVLQLTVEDDGPGPGAPRPHGVGLTNTRRRLEQLYGEAAALVLDACDGGGARQRVTLPSAGAS